eukprot:scaffold19256_cov128-Isochrysis_galbana.AAC.4
MATCAAGAPRRRSRLSRRCPQGPGSVARPPAASAGAGAEEALAPTSSSRRVNAGWTGGLSTCTTTPDGRWRATPPRILTSAARVALMQWTDSANPWSCAWKKAHDAAVMVMTHVGGSIVLLNIVGPALQLRDEARSSCGLLFGTSIAGCAAGVLPLPPLYLEVPCCCTPRIIRKCKCLVTCDCLYLLHVNPPPFLMLLSLRRQPLRASALWRYPYPLLT